MANVLNKVMGILGLDDSDFEDDIELEEEVENEEEEEVLLSNKKNSKVVNIHTNNAVKVVIIKPRDFDEVTVICDNLRNRKIVLVNVTELDQKVAQRLLDFMGGASYVLNGQLQEIEKHVYLLSPSNVDVSSDLKSELTGRGLFWAK